MLWIDSLELAGSPDVAAIAHGGVNGTVLLQLARAGQLAQLGIKGASAEQVRAALGALESRDTSSSRDATSSTDGRGMPTRVAAPAGGGL